MENKHLFLFAVYTTVLFFIARLVDMKFVKQEMLPLKEVIGDVAIVFGCAVGASYGYIYSSSLFSNVINFVTEKKETEIGAPEIFTQQPDF
jgi:hypothetical protein